MSRHALIALCCLALLGTPGCIFKSLTSQASSESSSKSSLSSSRSSKSSGSSSPGLVYRDDVKEATYEWLLAGEDTESFKADVSRMAEERGVSDWQNDEDTMKAIGRGIKRTGVRDKRLEEIKTDIAGDNEQAKGWIQKGYDREKKPN